MIAQLNGRLIDKTTDSVVVVAGGVGYHVYIPLSTYVNLPEENSEVTLNIHTHLRDDSIELYGFSTAEEKVVFKLLITVSGVGPKLARNILSGVAVADLAGALAQGDKARLSTIPGIGAKSAERLILELKDKVASLTTAVPPGGAATPDSLGDDVVSALNNLGYKSNLAEGAVKAAKETLAEGFGFEELLKGSLRLLSNKRK